VPQAWPRRRSVSAPLVGRALDRLGQRCVLPVLAAAFGIVLALLVLTAGYLGAGGVIFLAILAGLSRPPIEAGLRALWPRFVPGGQLDAACALDSTLQELIWIGGPLRSSRLRVLLAVAACYGAAAGILKLALVGYAPPHGGVACAGALVAIWVRQPGRRHRLWQQDLADTGGAAGDRLPGTVRCRADPARGCAQPRRPSAAHDPDRTAAVTMAGIAQRLSPARSPA
jgi:hypothetical protein